MIHRRFTPFVLQHAGQYLAIQNAMIIAIAIQNDHSDSDPKCYDPKARCPQRLQMLLEGFIRQ